MDPLLSNDDKVTKAGNAITTCDLIIAERQRQLELCQQDLLETIIDGVAQEKKLLPKTVGETSFNVYLTHIHRGEDVDSADAKQILLRLFEDAGCPPPKKKFAPQAELDKDTKAALNAHRENTHDIRRLTKELCGRLRSLRYFKQVRTLQHETDEEVFVACSRCDDNREVPVEEAAILSSCGHAGCIKHVEWYASGQTCLDADCKTSAANGHIVKAETLGHDRAAEGKGKHFGKKLENVVDIIKWVLQVLIPERFLILHRNQIPKKERVLVFVQYGDLLQKVAEAFTAAKVDFLTIEGSAKKMSDTLTDFQDGEARVLLLEVMDERASGANLTEASHAIFLSPLDAPSTEIYDACETQAIGRLRRYGQHKMVTIWQCVTAHTIDQEIYQGRYEYVKATRPAYIYDSMFPEQCSD